MTQVAPPPVLNFNLSGEEIRQLIKSIIAEERALNDEIAALKPEDQTFANVIPRIARFENANEGKIDLCGSLSHFSPDADVREASLEAEKAYSDFNIEQSMRHDLYTVIHNIYTNADLKSLDPQDERLLSRMERAFRRNGLHLSEDKRQELKALRNRLSDLRIEFNKNYNQESSTIKFTKEQLEGMDDDFLGGLKTVEEDGVQKYVLTMKYPDYIPVMKRCKREDTRKAYATAFESRNRENIPLLEEAVKIRRKSAKIMGYETHMDYVLEIKMAKKSEAVRKFLTDLVEKMRDLGLKEIEVMKELKKAEKAERGEEYDGKINAWDTSYYENILLETKYQLYPEEIKKYFSLENTVTKMLEIYETVLGLKFVKVSKEKAVVWHPDVQVYECWDAVEDQSFSGYMYLDLHPRDNKFPHAACFSIQPSYLEDDGSRVAPIAVMVANFTKPTADKPSLLKHDEVKTLFHELGHVMHHLCSRTKYARFHGTSVENDFVEAPSQMLENWCYDVRSLKYFSKHFETGESIPEETIERIIETKKVNAGVFNLRQLFFGIFDMEIHTTEDENLDTTKVYNELREKISLVEAPEGSCGQAAFGHLMGGYDAGYYGYMWSKVFSSDMFYSKFKDDTLSPKAGYEYRKCILEPGSSKDGMDLLKDFLGREPTSDAFMKEIM